eukprot:12925256-Prorocentrum_lima.AAC.1
MTWLPGGSGDEASRQQHDNASPLEGADLQKGQHTATTVLDTGRQFSPGKRSDQLQLETRASEGSHHAEEEPEPI